MKFLSLSITCVKFSKINTLFVVNRKLELCTVCITHIRKLILNKFNFQLNASTLSNHHHTTCIKRKNISPSTILIRSKSFYYANWIIDTHIDNSGAIDIEAALSALGFA